MIYTCYVTDKRKLIGIVSAKDLMTTDDGILISELMETEIISERASPRMTSVELCEPQFPPVSINIGIKDTRSGIAANASSYFRKNLYR